jgi:hypothetical protein
MRGRNTLIGPPPLSLEGKAVSVHEVKIVCCPHKFHLKAPKLIFLFQLSCCKGKLDSCTTCIVHAWMNDYKTDQQFTSMRSMVGCTSWWLDLSPLAK